MRTVSPHLPTLKRSRSRRFFSWRCDKHYNTPEKAHDQASYFRRRLARVCFDVERPNIHYREVYNAIRSTSW